MSPHRREAQPRIMAKLINCIECSKEVSSEAGLCVHCHNDPKGELCDICTFRSKKADLKFYRNSLFDTDKRMYAHPKCLDDVSRESVIVCPLCKSVNSDSEQCTNCGQPFRGLTFQDRCPFCNRIVPPGQGIRAFVTSAHGLANRRLHTACARNRKLRKTDCFIATATYGSELAPDVLVLTRFRDEVLLNSKISASLVGLYYRVSPPLTKLIERSELLKSFVRIILLSPISKLVKARSRTH